MAGEIILPNGNIVRLTEGHTIIILPDRRRHYFRVGEDGEGIDYIPFSTIPPERRKVIPEYSWTKLRFRKPDFDEIATLETTVIRALPSTQ